MLTQKQLLQRIEHLEQQHLLAGRRIKRLGTLAVCCLGLILLSGQVQPSDDGQAAPLETKGIKLVDERGNLRAELKVDEQGPALHLYDKNGSSRVALKLSGNDGGLLLRDGNETVRTELSLRDNVPMLQLSRASGKTAAQTFVSEKNGVGFEMNGAAATAGIRMNVTDQGNALVLGDTKGKVRILAGVGADGETALHVVAQNGEALLKKP